jgi:hypothetical protein
MIEEIKAYKCPLTGRLFEDPREATRCEFGALMRRFASQMPSGEGIHDAKAVADWLSSNLGSSIYQSAETKFLDVADYLRAHRETLCSR